VATFPGLTEDITVRKRAEAAMQSANRRLSTDLLRSQDYERRRIARELHDSTTQLLVALSLNLSRLRDLEEDTTKRRLVLEAIGLAGQCSQEIRTLSYLLHPPLLEEFGLASALQTYAEGFQRRTGIQLALSISPGLARLPRDVEMTIFRIVQEGLGNIHRHSGSPSARIALERNSQGVCLTLVDHGRGLPAALSKKDRRSVPMGVGILGMRERAELLGGRLQITSSRGGTTVTVILPLEEADE
jgi:two-component system NarL family sensor kinase